MKWIDKSLAIKATATGYFVKAMLLDAAGKTKERGQERDRGVDEAGEGLIRVVLRRSSPFGALQPGIGTSSSRSQPFSQRIVRA